MAFCEICKFKFLMNFKIGLVCKCKDVCRDNFANLLLTIILLVITIPILILTIIFIHDLATSEDNRVMQD